MAARQSRCHVQEIRTYQHEWMGYFVPGTSMGEIPCTSTKAHVLGKNGILLCTMCIMGRKVPGMIATSDIVKA